jgi:tetratricopeptide (TPR) repeat protein
MTWRHRRAAGFAALVLLAALAGCDETPDLDVDQLIRQAEALRQEGRVQASVAPLKQAIQKAPSHGEARFLLARSYLDLGDTAGAEKELDRALALGLAPERITPLLLRVWLPQRRFGRILEELEQTSTGAPLDAGLLVIQGKAHEGLGQPAQAERSYRLALERDPDGLAAPLALARLLLRERDHIKADRAITDALTRHPGTADLLALKGDLAYRLRDYGAARAAYGALLAAKPGDPTALIALAQAQIGAAAYAEAIGNLEAALAAVPRHRDANHLRALAAIRTGDHETAKLYSERALAADPSYRPSQLTLGMASYGLGHLEQAHESFQAVVSGDPSNGLARRLLAATRARLGQSEATAAKSGPAGGDDPSRLGRIAVVRSGDLDVARAYFQTQAAAFPDGDLPEGGSKAAARERLQAARTQAPGDVDEVLALARLAAQIGDLEDARRWLERAVAAAPEALLPQVYLAQLHLWRDRPAAALAVVDSVPEAHAGDPRVLAAAGLARLFLGQANPAAIGFRTLVDGDPDSAPARGLLALAYRDQGAMSRYRDQLQTISKIDPENLRAKVALISLLARDGQVQAAKQRLETLRKSAPADPEIAELEGALTLLEGRPSEAVWSFKRALERRPSGRLTVKLARAQHLAGDEPASRDSLKAWLEGDPEDRDVRLALANHYLALDRLEAAEANFRALLALAPDNVAALNNLAWIRLRLGDGPAALDAAGRADRLAPGRPRIMDTLALALAASGQTEPAVALLRRAAAVAPGDGDIARHLAALTGPRPGQEAAPAFIQRVISQDRR